MDTLIVHLPISNEYLAELESVIERNQLFVAGNFVMQNLATTEEYLRAKHMRGESFRVLFDRNILSRLAKLANGAQITMENEDARITRLAAACLAFCIVSEIEVEHGMALYEGANSSSHEEAEAEHRLFLTINNTHPGYCTEIALNKADGIPSAHLIEVGNDPELLSQTCKESELTKRLNLWRTNYLHILKLAELKRKHPQGITAAEHYFKWQLDESFFNGPAAIFGLAAISPSPPKGGMLKKIHTTDAQELQKNINNATWDVCYLTQWGRWITNPEEPHWLFASCDIALREIARTAFCDRRSDEREQLRDFLVQCWGKRDGLRLTDAYHEAKTLSSLGSSERKARTAKYFMEIENHINALKSSLKI